MSREAVEIEKIYMIYKKYEGNSVSVNIENVNDSDPYTKIDAKAFLSCKNVYEIKIPDTICEIGDWAFAHMKELKRLIVPAKKIAIGKDVFLDCDNLKEVVVCSDNTDNQGLPYLIATCITILKSYELLDFEMAAEQSEAWCNLYDAELLRYIGQPDERGFQPVIVGWFNDEGEEEQLQRYIETVKTNKIKICFLRLKYDIYIEKDTKYMILSYLGKQIDQSVNGDSQAWEVIKYELAGDMQYVRIAVGNNLLSEELILELIKFINTINASTEISAFLITSINGHSESIDEQFEL